MGGAVLGEHHATLTAQLEGECKYEQSTLYEYRYVSTSVAPSIRIEKLGWLHHKVVAPLKARELLLPRSQAKKDRAKKGGQTGERITRRTSACRPTCPTS